MSAFNRNFIPTNIVEYASLEEAISLITQKIQISQEALLKFSTYTKNAEFKAFVAMKNANPLAGICCQIPKGPLPLIPSTLKFGCFWGLWGEKQPLTTLVMHGICYLRSINVNKINVYVKNQEHIEILKSLNFTTSNLLMCDLEKKDNLDEIEEVPGIRIKLCYDEKLDNFVYSHWKKMWEENGIQEFKKDSELMTKEFLTNARKNNNCVIIGAFNEKNELVGSVCVNEFFGAYPNDSELIEKIGAVWAVYVKKEYRRRGIGTRLTREFEKYCKNIGCKKIRLIYASEEGKRIYIRNGFFESNNWISMDAKEIEKCFQPFICDVEISNSVFDLAVPAQLEAVGLNIESQFKGYFYDLNKFSSKGFDIEKLKNENRVAEKFDKLSTNWENYVVIAFKYEYIFGWIAKNFKLYKDKFNSINTIVLDACCGVGLPGQTLRMLGYEGILYGCDISSGMLKKAYQRGCFNELFVQNVEKGIKVFEGSIDLIILTGCMELLDIEKVVGYCNKAMKKGGGFWLSFQWDINKENPTEHQNVRGISKEKAIEFLKNGGFKILEIEECKEAFFTPKPKENGEGSEMVPVPYLFVVAEKI